MNELVAVSLGVITGVAVGTAILWVLWRWALR